MIKNFIASIIAFWAAFVFIITLLIIIIPVWVISKFKDPKATILLFKIFKPWIYVFYFLIGIRVILKGKENFKKGKNYVVVFNHNSFIDVPASCIYIPGVNKTMAKIEMSKIPIFGILYKTGSVLVDRKSKRSRAESFFAMKKVLEMGFHMCLYPEGTRNNTSEPLLPFKDGAFKLSIDTNKPILPALIFNSKKIMPTNKKFYLFPQNIEMHFLPAIYPENKTINELNDEVFDVMKNYYVVNYKK